MPPASASAPQQQLAVFIDFENIALGLQGSARFDVRRVLDRLLEKGKVIAKIAYADWNRFREYTQALHENGIELIEIPRRATSGKNSADIRLVVDAMDLSWSKEHIDTFVIVSGDSDFSPLVSKLKENGRHVIGLGMKASTSPLLANGCDEFIYYEDLEHENGGPAHGAPARPRHDRESAFRVLAETVRALQREGFEVIQASLVKDTIKRKRPAFSEASLGYGSFSELLEDAQEAGIVTLRKDERSGTYAVTPVSGGRRGGGRRGRPARPEGAAESGRPEEAIRGEAVHGDADRNVVANRDVVASHDAATREVAAAPSRGERREPVAASSAPRRRSRSAPGPGRRSRR